MADLLNDESCEPGGNIQSRIFPFKQNLQLVKNQDPVYLPVRALTEEGRAGTLSPHGWNRDDIQQALSYIGLAGARDFVLVAPDGARLSSSRD